MKRHYSHRGNVIGPTDKENHPDQINHAISRGFGVEIDVWKIGNLFFLGHDRPQYKIERPYLLQKNLLVHCKNVAALDDLFEDAHCFFHQNDQYTITSKGEIVCYPGQDPVKGGILMKCEHFTNLHEQFVLCSDYIEYYKDL
jgi:hypothetical protein